ncbi:MAG: hypothetical protein ACTTH5_04065 [Wolinella sp.]
MYDLYFYLLIWILLGIVAIPIMLISVSIVIIGNINDTQRAEAKRLARLQKIQFLLGILSSPKSSQKEVNEAFEAFKKYHATFGTLASDSAEFKQRIEFVRKIVLSEFFNIDNASKFRDEMVARNREHKKELEQTISQALKDKERGKESK